MDNDTLMPFFKPRSVVVIGASKNEDKLGYGVARNLVNSQFQGEIYFVNPKGGILFEQQVLSSIDELKNGIDLALIVVNAIYVPETLVACSQKGIKNFIIQTSGFKESGPEGALLEQECLRIARERGLRILGPNCIGVINTHLPLDTTFITPPMAEKGSIAFITQSGALGAALVDWARGEGVGFSRIVSLGNQLDVDESDVLRITAEDPSTKAVMIYLESVQDGEKFIREAQMAAEKKPVVVLKVGKSSAGQAAALSHTGALAGSDQAFDAVFRKAGVLRAKTVAEMFGWAKTLVTAPKPTGNRVAILTNAGGPGVVATDAIEENGLSLARLSTQTEAALSRILPEAASVRNPVDMLASATPGMYEECLQAILADDQVDMALVIAPPPPMFSAAEIADRIIRIIIDSGKPVAVSFMGNELVRDAINVLRRNNIPEFSFPEEGISGLGALWRHRQYSTLSQKLLTHPITVDKFDHLSSRLNGTRSNGKMATQSLVEELLKTYELPFLHASFAESDARAVECATALGYPVVMKIAVDGISHKSDLGGILLNIKTDQEVISGFNQLETQVAELGYRDKFKGVYIQKMIEGGQEVIVGGTRDGIFGPMVMFGSGGVDVEGLKDVEFSLAPITRSGLDHLLRQTWAGKKLNGFRQYSERDIPAVEEFLIKISQVLVDFPEIEEIEVNPLIVSGKDKGVFAVDTRIVLQSFS